MMRYTVVFWQPIIAIHQSAVLTYLATKCNVILVVEKKITTDRKESGWDIPEMTNVKIIISPSDEKIKDLIVRDMGYIHVFAGIKAYSMVYKAFKIAIKYPVKRVVRVEAYNSYGIKGLLLSLKYFYYYNIYERYIDILMPMGEMGVKAFEKIGFDKNKIIQWGYFVREKDDDQYDVDVSSQKPSVLFVGSIDKRKNILQLVDACKKVRDKYAAFTIIGRGELVFDLKKKIEGEEKIKYIESVLNTEMYKYMRNHDILVLPSLFDGWGAVVNEALHNGMRVITSNRCGSSVLIDASDRGEVYDIKEKRGIENAIINMLDKGRISMKERRAIIEWANKKISRDVAGEYFMDVLRFINQERKSLPTPPWLITSNIHQENNFSE
jgi:glycosyltransferase involved in cell wall biosynthesis